MEGISTRASIIIVRPHLDVDLCSIISVTKSDYAAANTATASDRLDRQLSRNSRTHYRRGAREQSSICAAGLPDGPHRTSTERLKKPGARDRVGACRDETRWSP